VNSSQCIGGATYALRIRPQFESGGVRVQSPSSTATRAFKTRWRSTSALQSGEKRQASNARKPANKKKGTPAMKKKTAKQPKQSKPTAAVKDLKPKKDPKGGLNYTKITY
jgi:hypothetical protein